MRILAPRYGVKIPFMIECGGWFNAGGDPDALVKAVQEATAGDGMSVSLGEAKVYCSVSGELIEADEATSGKVCKFISNLIL